jgi:hypothetical protein
MNAATPKNDLFNYLLPGLDFRGHSMFIGRMDIFDLTSNQLKRAAAIKDRIQALNNELRRILGGLARTGAAPKKRRGTRASVKSSTPPRKAKKKVFSAATRAKLSARLKAYWAAKRAGKR